MSGLLVYLLAVVGGIVAPVCGFSELELVITDFEVLIRWFLGALSLAVALSG